MKPRQKSDFQPKYLLSKTQQPRRWMLALMLTGVIIFKAYPTLIETLLKETYSLLATSWTQVEQMATGFSILPVDRHQADSTTEVTLTANCTVESNCHPTPLRMNTPSLSPMDFPDFPLSDRMSWDFQLTGFNASQKNSALPTQVIEAIRQDLTKQLEAPPQPLNVVQATPRNWPDTCLGLAQAGEFCGQQIISGWRVVVSAGDQTWVYRSDANGKLLRLESQQPASQTMPSSVIQAVFQRATQQSGLPDSGFKIMDAQPHIWPDSCLGLAQPEDFCPQTLVPGWQVTLSSGWEQWVYRTNHLGSQVQLDFAASSKGSGQPLQVYHSRDNSLFSRATQHSLWNALAQRSIAENTYNTLVGHQREARSARQQATGNGQQ
jgi:hypothetical protein